MKTSQGTNCDGSPCGEWTQLEAAVECFLEQMGLLRESSLGTAL